MVNIWKDYEVEQLKRHYQSESLESLAKIIIRRKGGIVGKLFHLAKENPEEWNLTRAREIYGRYQREKRGVDPEKYNPNVKWDNKEISKLKRHYLNKSIKRLEGIMKRGKYGILQRLYNLYEENPKEWDIKRMREFNTKLAREYRKSVHYKKRIKKRHEIYKRKLKKELKWNEWDFRVLANTYLTHSWLELARIFRLKESEAHVKLRELYDKDKDMWDIERILELEEEYRKYSLGEIKENLRYYVPLRWKRERELKRRPEIDNLIEQGLNMGQIGEEIGISKQAIEQYIKSRKLRDWYFKKRD